MWKCLCSLSPPPLALLFPPPLAVLGCQAILVSDRNKSFRRASVGQPLSPTKSSRIRSQRPLSPQPAGLGEIYCEERKKVVISWHFHDETWPKLCWLGGLEAHKECGCVCDPPHPRAATRTHSLAPPPPDPFPSCRPAGLGPGSPPTHQDDQGSVFNWLFTSQASENSLTDFFILKIPTVTHWTLISYSICPSVNQQF